MSSSETWWAEDDPFRTVVAALGPGWLAARSRAKYRRPASGTP